jgi:hypothetical protein
VRSRVQRVQLTMAARADMRSGDDIDAWIEQVSNLR